jgi:transposase-like protein
MRNPSSIPQGPNPQNGIARNNKKLTRGVGKRKVKEVREGDNELVRLGIKLHDAGFNVVPVDNNKKPLTSWAYNKRIERDRLSELLRKASGIAIVGGPENPFKGASVLVLVDVDRPSVIDRSPFLKELISKTVSWYTGPRCPRCEGKNLEVLEPGRRFRCSECKTEFTIEECRRGIGLLVTVDLETHDKYFRGTARGKDIEFLVKNYQLIPPSIHPSGVRYEWINPIDFNSPSYGIYPLVMFEVEKLLNELGILKTLDVEPEEKTEAITETEAVEGVRRNLKKLSDDEIKRIRDLILKYYIPGHRDRIIFSLLGVLIKAGVDYESSKRLVELVATEANDEEAKQRLYLVDYHYGKRVNVVGIEKLRGISGLRDELESALRERGLSEDEIAKQVSETITELYSALGLAKIPHTAWLKRKDNMVFEWVYAGKQGIYLFKRKSIDDSPVVQIISNAVIRKVKEVKILGLGLRNLYKVDIDGEVIVGSVDEIASYIDRYYGIERGSKYAIQRLIQFMSEEEEELFYSPGPWVVNGGLVFAKEPGYITSWKQYLVWNIPKDDVDVELKKNALEAIKKFVASYRNPAKVSLVLSYAAITPIAHYIKRVLDIVFHVLIHGVEDTGKSVIIEMLKHLFGVDDERFHPIPLSDFQARVCLSLSTLPAIIDEIGGLIEGYKNGKKDAIESLEVIHRAATQELLRVSGGYQYGGYFLAVRVIIAATNSDISFVPWQLDKFIPVEISIEDGINVSKAIGYTPRTMDVNVKKALRYVGIELLREVEKLVPEIDKLRNLPRDEIRNKLVELGYNAWVNLYRKYGLDPFPPPSTPETSLEKANSKEQYKDVFTSYISLARDGKLKDVVLNVYDKGAAEVSTEALDSLKKYHVIEVVGNDGKKEIVCKTPFITKFGEYLSKEYGLPKMGWMRLSEIIGLKRTRRKIGGKTFNNLLCKKLD